MLLELERQPQPEVSLYNTEGVARPLNGGVAGLLNGGVASIWESISAVLQTVVVCISGRTNIDEYLCSLI